jgi:hypothetical protein
LFGRLRAGAHQDQHPLGLRVTGVVDDVHLPAGALAQLRHQLLDHDRHPGIERVDRLPGLEVCVGVLRGAADERPLRRQRTVAVLPNQRLRHQVSQIVVVKQLDRVEFV